MHNTYLIKILPSLKIVTTINTDVCILKLLSRKNARSSSLLLLFLVEKAQYENKTKGFEEVPAA